LQGGALFKSKLGGYLAKCAACYKANPKIHENCFDTAQER